MAVIERDAEDCDRSLRAMGMGCTQDIAEAFARSDGRRWRFDDIWIESKAHDLWAFLLPGIPFDAIRYRQLRDIQVQPHMSKWRFEPSVFDEMTRREAGG